MEFHFKRKLAVAGHRGDRDYCPENTIQAFQGAIDKGVDMVETDVHMTRDGYLVLMHDHTVDRTTDGTGLVSEMTLEEIQKLNVVIQEGNAQPVPMFEDCLKLIADSDMLLNIEIKDYYDGENGDFCRESIDKVVELVERYDMVERTVFNSFDAFALQYIHSKHPDYMLHGFYPYDIMRNVDQNPDEYLYCACIFDDKNAQLYEDLRQKGIRPWVGAGVREYEHIKLCYAYGAELVTTNDPGTMVAYAEQAVKEVG